MYEALEHWNQYKKELEELKNLKYLELAMAKLKMDKFLNELTTKNGTTKL